eukprot:COSAG06_NODE_6239_length_3022_cov_1.766678_1_plen_85_part_00
MTYHGVNAHAAGAPWAGVNALDATVQGYTNVAMMRQQMKPAWRVHGVITDGGEFCNRQSEHTVRHPVVVLLCTQLRYCIARLRG